MTRPALFGPDVKHRARLFVQSTWGQGLLVATFWQLMMLVVGFLFDRAFSEGSTDLLGHTNHWDAGWYRHIIETSGYQTNPAAPVFYPLFPLAVHLVQFLSFGLIGVLVAGFFVNTIAVWLAAVALLKIAKLLIGSKYRWLPLVLFFAAPAAIFMHFFYAEALFCALAFWAYYLALTRRWGWMAGVLALLTAVKLPALLVVGLCGLEFMRAYDWQLKKIFNRNLLWFLAAPLGFLCYGLYLASVHGDFLAMFHGYQATTDWAYHTFNPNFLGPIIQSTKATLSFVFGQTAFTCNLLVNDILPVAGLLVVGAASIYALIGVRGWAIPLGVTGLVSIVFFSLNNNLISVHRYLLPSLVLYLIPVIIMQRFKRAVPVLYAYVAVGIVLQLYLFSLFVRDGFAG